MKKKSPELDVDFIQSRLLTKTEELQLSEFIRSLKNKKKKHPSKKAA